MSTSSVFRRSLKLKRKSFIRLLVLLKSSLHAYENTRAIGSPNSGSMTAYLQRAKAAANQLSGSTVRLTACLTLQELSLSRDRHDQGPAVEWQAFMQPECSTQRRAVVYFAVNDEGELVSSCIFNNRQATFDLFARDTRIKFIRG